SSAAISWRLFPGLGRIVDHYKRCGIRELVKAPYRITAYHAKPLRLSTSFTRPNCLHRNAEAVTISNFKVANPFAKDILFKACLPRLSRNAGSAPCVHGARG